MLLTPGTRVRCREAEWLVTRVETTDYAGPEYAVFCTGADDLVRGKESVFLTALDTVEPVDPRNTRLTADDSNGYRRSKLFLEAHLRQIPRTGIEADFDGMGAFTPMEFQKNTVRKALSQLRPRLLLADAVGLGKTIQVGMVLVELLRRSRANRILVLTKKSMLTQFQSELWNRFAIPLVRLDSQGIARLRLRIPASKNPFEVYHRVIISIDTLKDVARYEHFLERSRWDVVIIDEAHNVAGASVPERNLSFRLARLLSRRADSILLTTATPHNGRRETFGRLISLLDPSAIPDPTLKEYGAEDIRDFFLMRFKEDVRDEAGELLAERVVIPRQDTTISATEDEETIYRIFAEARKAAREARARGEALVGWRKDELVQYGLYKSFLSSPEACCSTVEKRRKITAAADQEEVGFLDRLHGALAQLSIARTSRFQLLLQQLKEIGWDGSPENPRILLFTESRRTQDALIPALLNHFGLKNHERPEEQAKSVIAYVHGSMSDIHLMDTVEAFATGGSPLRMLVATDVASEGVNLHHECHHIIHYDLPWSIITLVQRNGRIDRLGQRHSPIIRYLLVETENGLLSGDSAIFDRLIQKVEEINGLRQSGESVLQIYDAEGEERYIAQQGIIPGNMDVLTAPSPEDGGEQSEMEQLLNMARSDSMEDYLRFLLGNGGNEGHSEDDDGQSQTISAGEDLRLYADRKFLIDGYRYLAEYSDTYPPLTEEAKTIVLQPPADLKRRLGDTHSRDGVIFGATAIPAEAWPDSGQFRLTDDVDRVELAIQAARNTSGYWSSEVLCTEHHPILQWITERLLMQIPRGQAPMIASPHLDPGEFHFCFLGQVSSKAGTPLVVDPHAIVVRTGGKFSQMELRESLERAHLENVTNTGEQPDILAAQALLHSAVDQSLTRMRNLRTAHMERLKPLVDREEKRLQTWSERRRTLLQARIADLAGDLPQAQKSRKLLAEIDDYLRDRKRNWREMHFDPADEPSTRLVLVIGSPARPEPRR